jgi:hypothetical protein
MDSPEISQEVKLDAVFSEVPGMDSAPANADMNVQPSAGLFDCKQCQLTFCAASFERRYEVQDGRHV